MAKKTTTPAVEAPAETPVETQDTAVAPLTPPETLKELCEMSEFKTMLGGLPAMLEPKDMDYEVGEDLFILLSDIEDYDQQVRSSKGTISNGETARMIISVNRAALDFLSKVAVDEKALTVWAHSKNPYEQFEALTNLLNFYGANLGK